MKRAARLTRVLWTGLFILAAAPPARPADVTDPVAGHPGLTYFDLMKLVITDLAKDKNGASGHHVVPFRHIEGEDAKADVGDTVALGSIDTATIAGEDNRLLVLADFGSSEGNVEEAELLALFSFSPKPRLIDVVEVGNDRWTAMSSDKPPLLAPDAPLIVIDSGHFNSNESYNSSEIIFVRNDRFSLIDTLFTFSESFCAFSRQQQPAFVTAPNVGPYKAVKVSVRETVKLTHEDGCSDQPAPRRGGVKTYAATYRWNAGSKRFVADSKSLEALQKINTDRVNAP